MPRPEAERQEEPRDHRPAPHGAQPRVVEVPGDERRHAERERDRQADEPEYMDGGWITM